MDHLIIHYIQSLLVVQKIELEYNGSLDYTLYMYSIQSLLVVQKIELEYNGSHDYTQYTVSLSRRNARNYTLDANLSPGGILETM